MNSPLAKNRILFIDDSQTEINYLELLFQVIDLPLEPSFINAAEKALDLLSESDAKDFPDVIVVDINMPLMTGFEFAESYMEKFKLKYPLTLLFIYSTSINSADIKRAESISGVSGFIPKPFTDKTYKRFIFPHLSSIKNLEANNK